MLIGKTALCLLLAFQDASVDLDEPKDVDPASRPFLEVEIQVQEEDSQLFSYGFDESNGWTVYSFSTQGRPGVAAVVGGYGRTSAPIDSGGISVLFFIHFFEDARSFVEVQLLNDVMEVPPGRVPVRHKITMSGDVLSEGSGLLADQAGLMVWGGELRFAPHEDLLAQLKRQLPTGEDAPGPGLITLTAVEDPDPHRDTGLAGFGRTRLFSPDAVRYLLSEDSGHLDRLMGFVAAQARRPYHLSSSDGEPFFQDRYPEASFVGGRPESRVYQETFGRMLLTADQLDAGGFDGWDAGHLSTEDLYAAYVLVGSRLARRGLVLIAEQLLSTTAVGEERSPQRSARHFGWSARTLMRAYQATGQDRYRIAVRRMMGSLKGGWLDEGPFRALVPQAPDAEVLGGERFERPADVAIAASAIALYLQESPGDPDALELLEFCGDLLVERGHSPDAGGFFQAYSAESDRKAGDGTLVRDEMLAVPTGLIAVARLVDEEKRERYRGVARGVYSRLIAEGVAVGSEEWCRWLVPVASGLD